MKFGVVPVAKESSALFSCDNVTLLPTAAGGGLRHRNYVLLCKQAQGGLRVEGHKQKRRLYFQDFVSQFRR